MNIVSEMFAAARYVSLARNAREPVLQWIARNVGGDEARHATSFTAYARKHLARSSEPELDRLAAVKVLHFWLCEHDQIQHPVGVLDHRATTAPELAQAIAELPIETERLAKRICLVVGNLIERPLAGPDDLKPAMRELIRATRQKGALFPEET
jgi:hypothetical protein